MDQIVGRNVSRATLTLDLDFGIVVFLAKFLAKQGVSVAIMTPRIRTGKLVDNLEESSLPSIKNLRYLSDRS